MNPERAALFFAALLIAGSVMSATRALADPSPAPLPTLRAFVAASRGHALEDQEAASTLEQRDAEKDLSTLAFVPKLSATAGYTRNQSAAVAHFPNPAGGTTEVTITPQDELDATFRLDVTLFDAAVIRRIAVASARRDEANSDREATTETTERQVVSAYYDRVAAEGLERASETALGTAIENAKVIEVREAAELASDLDLERAKAEVDRQRGNLAVSRRAKALASRKLRTLTGLDASGAAPRLDTPLDEEPPLESFLASASDVASVRAAKLEAHAADATADATWLGLAPRLTGSASERFTNAVGFGTSPNYALNVTASWALDPLVIGNGRVDRAAAKTAHLRAERARRDAADAIEDAWEDTAAKREAANAARPDEEASKRAAAVARSKRDAGKATELDVLVADRDAFQAEVSRVQADADLEAARATLAIVSRRGAP